MLACAVQRSMQGHGAFTRRATLLCSVRLHCNGDMTAHDANFGSYWQRFALPCKAVAELLHAFVNLKLPGMHDLGSSSLTSCQSGPLDVRKRSMLHVSMTINSDGYSEVLFA